MSTDSIKTIPSPAGPITLIASEKGLKSLQFSRKPQPTSIGTKKSMQIVSAAEKQLKEYFLRRRTKFDLPLDIVGSEFQKRVWSELQQIPFGQTKSYKDIARLIKRDKAMRAVGNANGKNPLCIVVPCHRVIANDGTLGGFSGGLKLKKLLLSVENNATVSS